VNTRYTVVSTLSCADCVRAWGTACSPNLASLPPAVDWNMRKRGSSHTSQSAPPRSTVRTGIRLQKDRPHSVASLFHAHFDRSVSIAPVKHVCGPWNNFIDHNDNWWTFGRHAYLDVCSCSLACNVSLWSTKLIWIIFTNLVLTSKKTQRVSMTTINCLGKQSLFIQSIIWNT
jgi:hypothetical protein